MLVVRVYPGGVSSVIESLGTWPPGMPADLDLIRGRAQQLFNDLNHHTSVRGGVKGFPAQLRCRSIPCPDPMVRPCRWDTAAGVLWSSWLSTQLQEGRVLVFVRWKMPPGWCGDAGSTACPWHHGPGMWIVSFGSCLWSPTLERLPFGEPVDPYLLVPSLPHLPVGTETLVPSAKSTGIIYRS